MLLQLKAGPLHVDISFVLFRSLRTPVSMIVGTAIPLLLQRMPREPQGFEPKNDDEPKNVDDDEPLDFDDDVASSSDAA